MEEYNHRIKKKEKQNTNIIEKNYFRKTKNKNQKKEKN
jgi:hypothetical protein